MRTEPPTGDDLTRMLVSMKRNVLDEASRDPAPARRRARNRAIVTSTAILLTLGLGAGAAIAAGMIGEDENPRPGSQPTAPAPAAAPAPTPTPRPFGIETAAPVDPLTTVTEIVVRPERLDLHDVDGTLVTSLSYDAEVSEFIGTLETVLGVAPELTSIDASGHTPPTTQYLWDGLEVRDDHEDQWHPDVPTVLIDMNVMVWATAPVIGDGVTVRTVGGFRPGDDSEALAAELGQPSGADFAGLRVETGDPIGERNPGFDDVDNAYSVAVRDWWRNPGQTIILAPWNFGVGHA